MKPKNFPDRKNTRRKVALSHLSTPTYRKPHADSTGGICKLSSEKEESALQITISPHGRRDVRTKKHRGLSA